MLMAYQRAPGAAGIGLALTVVNQKLAYYLLRRYPDLIEIKRTADGKPVLGVLPTADNEDDLEFGDEEDDPDDEDNDIVMDDDY